MNLLTPAFLVFVPLWATSLVMRSALMAMSPLPPAAPRKPHDDEVCPTQWAAMPFTPPAVHAA